MLGLVNAVAGVNAVASWTQLVKHAPWQARSDPQLASLGSLLLLLGGHASNSYFNDCWASSDGGLTWSELPTPPWANRSYHTAKTFNGTLYLLGGHDGKTWYNVRHTRLDPRSDRWNTPVTLLSHALGTGRLEVG